LGSAAVGHWLQNTLYKGVLTFGANCTGIINDVRRVEPNNEQDIVIKENFCEAIVEPELWDAVAAIRRARRRIRRAPDDGKLMRPLAPGCSVTLMLSGLARCGACGACMRPVTSGRKSKAGRSYAYYECPRKRDGGCENPVSVPESWMRAQVIGYLRDQLFGSHRNQESGFPLQLRDKVREYVQRRMETRDDPRPQLEATIAEIDSKISGWALTLANPNLPSEVRRRIESDMNSEIERKAELGQSLAEANRLDRVEAFEIGDKGIRERLARLDEVLAAANPTLAHLELSLHIDRIDCFASGEIAVRFCRLGIAGQDLIEAMAAIEDRPTADPLETRTRRYRRRTRLHAASQNHQAAELEAISFWAADPDRFSELGEHWFETVTFVVPGPTFWAKEKAVAVSEQRLAGMTHEKLAEHFGVTVPTIRKALRLGRSMDARFTEAPQKMPRARWHEDHAHEVLAARKTMSVKEMVRHFQKSDVTLRKAIKFAQERVAA
jgi:hypothetical protein